MNEKERQEIEDARAVLKKIRDARANGRTEGDAESDGKVKWQNMKMEENPMDEGYCERSLPLRKNSTQ